ncbi:MAG TPA: GNAT family N-acetyltransferase [Rubrivivax sp.]|nr:GNAT family N-acetyltransferase [Rubrivivax sp.]
MSPTQDDFHFEAAAALRDGRPVTIRLMRPDDKQRLIEAFSRLDRQSIYTRFFSLRTTLPEGPLERIDRIDGVRLAALVATIGSGGDETVIGSATYVADTAADGVREAEVAFTIEEDFQRQGLAGRLLQALAGIARRHGIGRFTAEVLAGNAPMLAVFKRCGLATQTRHSGGVVHVVVQL